ncbi:MAG: hypothetical protein SFX73_33410 [Kofleriaceae bacterium]|nr:hypothetical protein [Kofleriaceae bacterium]
MIGTVAVRGVDSDLAQTLRSLIEARAGQRLEDAPLREDLKRMWRLGVLADARVEVTGDELAYVVTPRPRIGRVVIPMPDPVALRRFALLAGVQFDPARLHRIASATEVNYVRAGHLDAHVAVTVAPRSDRIDICVAATPGPRVTLAKLELAGARQIPDDVLRKVMHGAKGGVNVVGGIYDADALNTDRIWLLAAYFDRGMLLAQVGTPIVERRGTRLAVTVPISEGPVLRFGTIWTDNMPHIPLPISRGQVASRVRIAEVREALATLVGASIDVRTEIHPEKNEVDVGFVAERRWPWDVLSSWRSRSP